MASLDDLVDFTLSPSSVDAGVSALPTTAASPGALGPELPGSTAPLAAGGGSFSRAASGSSDRFALPENPIVPETALLRRSSRTGASPGPPVSIPGDAERYSEAESWVAALKQFINNCEIPPQWNEWQRIAYALARNVAAPAVGSGCF